MNKKKAIKIATASAIAASGFVAVAPAQAAVKTTNVNTVVNTAISKMAAAYDGYHKPGLQGKIPPTAKIRQLTTNAEAAYDAAVAAIAKDGGTKSQKAAFTKKLNAKKYLLTRAQGYVKAIDVNLNAAKKALDKAVASGKAKDVKAAEAALVKTAATFEKAVKAVYGPSTRKALVAKYHAPALAKAATVADELKVYNAYKEIENGNLIEKDLEKAGKIITETKPTVDKLKAGDKRDTKLVKNLLDAVEKNDAKYYGVYGPVDKITAINATTVEVKYKEAVKDVASIKYSIEGLTVTNAAVKQTDSKTVVLTTSTQEGAKEYTIKSGAVKVGSFKGVSAVIPSAIKVTTPTVQGTIGKQVTVKAEVTVAEGQSKAGIPVTFNIINDNSNLNSKIEVEAFTDEKGVATYSYTRYYKHNDNVTAYATEKSSVYSSGKVYWAEGLTLTEVTTGNELANGAKKVYKVNTSSYKTAIDSTGKPYNYVNVAFVENVNVAPDKLIRDVKVIDTGLSLADYTSFAEYPSQVTTGGINEVRVKVNVNGEATFTLTGNNSAVTPVVFVDSNDSKKWEDFELQASAPKVSFVLNQTIGLDVKAEGVQNAASMTNNGYGGRDYTVTVTSKDGKIAPAGTEAYVVFPQGSVSKDKKVYIDGVLVEEGKSYKISVTGTKGQAGFTLTGQKDGFAAPTVYLDNGSAAGKLDSSDLQKVGEITYFVNAVIQNAEIKVTSTTSGEKEVTSVPTNESAIFTYQALDQNGFPNIGLDNYQVTYEITTSFKDVVVSGKDLPDTVIPKGTTKSVKVTATGGVAKLTVNSSDASTVTVNASSSQGSLPNKTATVTFTKNASSVFVTGPVTDIDPVNKKLTVTESGKEHPYSYATGTYQIAGQPVTRAGFESKLVNSEVTVVKTAEGALTFNIIKTGTEVIIPEAPTAPNLTKVTVGPGDTVSIPAVKGGQTSFLAPVGTTDFVDNGTTITSNKTVNAVTITAPTTDGEYALFVVDNYGRSAKSMNLVTVDATAPKVVGSLFTVANDNPSPTADKISGADGAISESLATVKGYIWIDANSNGKIEDTELGSAFNLGSSTATGSVASASIGNLDAGAHKIVITATDAYGNESAKELTAVTTINLTE